ncbi:hypothetical protein [Alteromonas flava]|uniref:hypothetical protein n=1 Tax=Alteromonas flava TaxID=2048003 RepID=UPI000F5F5F6A|nr:hypothetical protein [Alteromonas flava]
MDFLIEQHLFGFKKLGSRIETTDGIQHNKSFQHGYSVATENGVFTGLFLNFTEGNHAFKSFKGLLKFKGQLFTFSEQTTVQQIEAIFGTAVDGFKDEVEISRRFVVSDLLIECSWYHDSDGISFTYMSIEKDDGFYQTSGT